MKEGGGDTTKAIFDNKSCFCPDPSAEPSPLLGLARENEKKN